MSTADLAKIVRRAKRKKELILTPRLDEYLLANRELFPYDDEVAEIVRAIMTRTPRNRAQSFSSSSRGSCLRAQMFGYMGVPQISTSDVVLQNLFSDGHWRHLRWQALLLHARLIDEVEYPFEIVETETDTVWVRGSLDGINLSERWGLEIKGIRTLKWVDDGPLDSHLLQIHTYMMGTGIDTFVLLYEDKLSSDWREFVVRRDEKIMDEVLQEIETLIDSAKRRRLPVVQEECKNGKGAPFTSCPYRRVCLGTADWSAADSLVAAD